MGSTEPVVWIFDEEVAAEEDEEEPATSWRERGVVVPLDMQGEGDNRE